MNSRLRWSGILLFLLVIPAYGQSELSLKGAIDFHVHSSPDSVPRSIDADDLARLAKESGMRGLVLKNHYESTAALAYMVRKEVPGIEVFGGITMDLSNGGITLEAVKRMILMKGGWGRIVWLPTQDAENDWKRRKTGSFVPIAKDGKLLPNVIELIDFIAQHHEIVFETGHISAEEILLVVHEAHQRGVTHIVVTHATYYLEDMTVPQMQQAARDGAYLEFDADGPFVGPQPRHTIADYADAIRQVGPEFCILSTNFGTIHNPPFALHPQGLLDFMVALHKEGISVADINRMAKTNPALALGLQP
jgi:hypothetical protein